MPPEDANNLWLKASASVLEGLSARQSSSRGFQESLQTSQDQATTNDAAATIDSQTDLNQNHACVEIEGATSVHAGLSAGLDEHLKNVIRSLAANLASNERTEEKDVLVEAFTTVGVHIIAEKQNQAARLYNRTVTTVNDRLIPLRNIRSNILIPGFPTTVASIAALQGTAISDMIEQLGVTSPEDDCMRLKLFKLLIGIHASSPFM